MQEQELNPVVVWEGIDTQAETGRNRLAKLAIHILSIIANSAGCERAFSHMGLIHTGIRSKLGVEKVRKTTMVGMDIKWTHLEAGLLPTRARRQFTSQLSTSGQPDLGSDSVANNHDFSEPDDLLDFSELSEQLIASAAAASHDKDVGDDNDDEFPPIPPLTITIPPLSSTTLSNQATRVKKTSIPLEVLFEYPTDADPPAEGLNSFWKGGIENLEKEMEAYEILCSNEQNIDGMGLENPSSAS